MASLLSCTDGEAMAGDGLTRDHIIWAYRILLDRDPENEAVIAPKLKGYQSTQQLRADIVTSHEYQSKNRDFAHTNVSTIVIKELDRGLRLFVDLADHAIGLPIVRDQFEQSELAFIRRVVKPGDHVLDVGAHIGFFAVHMAALVGASGSVTAFEPYDENAELLERSARENQFDRRLRIERAAVGRTAGRAQLAFATETLNSGGAFVVTGAPPSGHAMRSVQMVALDDMKLPRPIAFMKMDVEGAEPLVVEGASKLIAEDRPILLSELHAEQLARVSQISPDDFLSRMRALNYRAFRVEGGTRSAEISKAPAEPICSMALVPRERC
jgi:FkbM family methyltransferase